MMGYTPMQIYGYTIKGILGRNLVSIDMSIATQKSIARMKKFDWNPWMVERFLPGGAFGIRRDLYHIIDIIGMNPQKGFIGVQSTTTARTSHLLTLLIDQHDHSRDWLLAGAQLELWCWRKIKRKKKDGSFSKLSVYVPRIDVITLDLLEEAKRRYDNDPDTFSIKWIESTE